MSIQFNPSTQKVLYNPNTNRILRVLNICDKCPEGTTPESIKVTTSGILCCPGAENCCPSPSSKNKIISLGIGWNGISILKQGRITWAAGVPTWDTEAGSECHWGEIIYDDFGQFEEYNLHDCGGGVSGTYNWTMKVTQVKVLSGGEEPVDSVQVIVTLAGSASTSWGAYQIFHGWPSGGPWSGKCFPYDLVIDSDHDCALENRCAGDGTAIITEL